MLSPKRPATAIERPVAKQRKCGACGLIGHNHRKCPSVPAAAAAPVAATAVDGPNFENDVEEADSPPPPVPTANDDASYIDWGSVLYVVFDLETTGKSRQRDEITSSWPRSFWIVRGSKLKMPFSQNLSSQQNPYHPSLRR
jgi:hypothetical protein